MLYRPFDVKAHIWPNIIIIHHFLSRSAISWFFIFLWHFDSNSAYIKCYSYHCTKCFINTQGNHHSSTKIINSSSSHDYKKKSWNSLSSRSTKSNLHRGNQIDMKMFDITVIPKRKLIPRILLKPQRTIVILTLTYSKSILSVKTHFCRLRITTLFNRIDIKQEKN